MLPGGGVRGSFQVGALSAILGSGKYTIDAVYGCSVGAILAPLVAAENVDKLKTLFTSIQSLGDVVQRHTLLCGLVACPDWPIALGLASFLWLGAYQSIKLVDAMFAVVEPAELAVAKARCHVVAYDVLRNVERWFTGDELVQGVRCSSALWLAVPPVSYSGTLFSDGGATAVFPVNYVIDHAVKAPFDGAYLFLDCDARLPFTAPAPTDGLTLMSDLQRAAATRLANFEYAQLQAALSCGTNPLILVRPDVNLLQSALDIDPTRMRASFDAGVAKGTAFLASFPAPAPAPAPAPVASAMAELGAVL